MTGFYKRIGAYGPSTLAEIMTCKSKRRLLFAPSGALYATIFIYRTSFIANGA